MLLQRSQSTGPGAANAASGDVTAKQLPTLEQFLQARDFSGAAALLEFQHQGSSSDANSDSWLAYCAFHLGDFARAAEQQLKVARRQDAPADSAVHLGCCYFMLGRYKEADEEAQKASGSDLSNRLQLHLAHRFGDHLRLLRHQQLLQDTKEDLLSLASVHFMRSRYQEAIDIFKRILLRERDCLALNVYIALCYYKLDYNDVSQEVLAVYLQEFPDSVTSLNLKACNLYKLYNARSAEVQLMQLKEIASSGIGSESEIVRHNLVTFRGGFGALQVLPSLLDTLPEARLNLVIFHLRQQDVHRAHELLNDLDPNTPQEFILKGIVSAILGQETGSQQQINAAQQYFQLVGGSAADCDSIAGRQCMASYFFLLRQFTDVLVYLDSIKGYFYTDDTFNFNYAQAKAAVGRFKEAEEAFLLVQNENIKHELVYLTWLARCFIRNNKSRFAWQLYLRMDTSFDAFCVLRLIANDCYRMGHFYYSAKAFDLLEKLDSNCENFEGKRGACAGLLQQIVAGVEPKERLQEVVQLLISSSNSQADSMLTLIKNWATKENLPI